MDKIKEFNTDYVYYDFKTNEYKNVHITLNVGEKSFVLELNTDVLLDKSVIEELLNQLNQNAFKRLRISIINDCTVVMIVKGKKYTIDAVDSGIVVTKIKLEEE